MFCILFWIRRQTFGGMRDTAGRFADKVYWKYQPCRLQGEYCMSCLNKLFVSSQNSKHTLAFLICLKSHSYVILRLYSVAGWNFISQTHSCKRLCWSSLVTCHSILSYQTLRIRSWSPWQQCLWWPPFHLQINQ